MVTGPSIVRLGEDIPGDVGGKGSKKTLEFFKELFSILILNTIAITDEVNLWGSLHGDSIFAILKPGLILIERRSHLFVIYIQLGYYSS